MDATISALGLRNKNAILASLARDEVRRTARGNVSEECVSEECACTQEEALFTVFV